MAYYEVTPASNSTQPDLHKRNHVAQTWSLKVVQFNKLTLHNARVSDSRSLRAAYMYKKYELQHQFKFIRRLSWSISSNFGENSLFKCASNPKIAKNH